MASIGRRAYAEIFGPTVGDRLRLADTNLLIEVEADYTLRAGSYGEEVKFGGGKTIRDGMAQSQKTRAEGAMDTVMTNALILDHWGIVKADIGLKGGRIAAIGKAGNPDVQPGVDIIIGPRYRDHQLRRHDRDGRRHRLAHPFHLPAADRGSAGLGRHHHDGRRHGTGHRHLCHHLHAGAVEHRAHAAGR